MLVVFSSPDPDGGNWTPVAPKDVPDAIKDPDVMGSLVAGEIGKIVDGELWYRVEHA